jgi:threonylcarbamoyladenosine tRNA methylthiotransferase MtaB
MIDTSAFQGKKAAYYTLGCKLNFSETSTFGKMLQELGVRTAEKGEQADICLINTCSVTEVADHKCRQAIHRMVRQHPGAFVVVTGCYAQLEPETVVKIEGVDLVLGSHEKANLVQYLSERFADDDYDDDYDNDNDHDHDDDLTELKDSKTQSSSDSKPDSHGKRGYYKVEKTKDIKSFAPSCSRGNRTRYFLKVQDGCDYFCTYCTIPYARGFSRNPTIESLVKQAKEAADEGGKEIVLTGVNIGDFGKTTGESFTDLVKALDKVEGISRYRISSIEPDLLTDELIRYCAGSRAFMPHFHIPLQSGSDEVLKLMHRRYDKALFAHKIELIKQLMPDAFIGVDVMVGCRGERPECFEECYDFLKGLDVTQLHVFPYSERPGTAALRIPYVVSDQDKKERSRRLLALSDEKTEAFYARYIGTEAEVLFEKAPRGKAMHGFTRNYIRVELSPSEAKAEYDNQLMKVRLGNFNFDKSALKGDFNLNVNPNDNANDNDNLKPETIYSR